MYSIGKQGIISLFEGGVQDGTPTYGTEQVITAFCTDFSVDGSIETVNQKGRSDTSDKHRFLSSSTRVRCTLRVPVGGATVPLSHLGRYYKVEFKEDSTATETVLEGILSTCNLTSPENGEQTQVIEIMVGAA
jgi:hypothetical protein